MTLSQDEDGRIVLTDVIETKEEPPLDNIQVGYLRYLERRREFAAKHRHDSSPVNFETFCKMIEDFNADEDAFAIRHSIAKLLYAEQDDGLLRIRKDT